MIPIKENAIEVRVFVEANGSDTRSICTAARYAARTSGQPLANSGAGGIPAAKLTQALEKIDIPSDFPDKLFHFLIAVEPRDQCVLGVIPTQRIDIVLHVGHRAVPDQPVSFYFLLHKPFLASRPFTAMEIKSKLKAANVLWWKLVA